MKSACEALIYRTYLETWKRGEKYADQGKISITKADDRKIIAQVSGTKKYEVILEFRGGGISRSCSCPVRDFCKHMIAVAIIWDEARGMSRPTPSDIEAETIPPPAITYSQVKAVYDNPLTGELDVIRIAADELGWGGRPHARLPNMPKIKTDPKQPLSITEIKQAFKEIENWTKRRNYDLYFCAGEMSAAYCEVLRTVLKRLERTNPLQSVDILLAAQEFHYKLVMEMIDDSDGHWQIHEAHLEEIYKKLKQTNNNDVSEKLKIFDQSRDNY